MKRLTYSENISFDSINRIHKEYKEYLSSLRGKIPSTVFEFAYSPWHYDPSDERCLHDAQLLSLQMTEIEDSSLPRSSIEIIIRLLGSRKNLISTITYKDVRYYSFYKRELTGVLANAIKEPTTYHGEWLIDEFYLSSEALIVHEIEFSFNSHWKICFTDMNYSVERT